jgi:hypothetical protein
VSTSVAALAGVAGIALVITAPVLALRGTAISQPERPATGSATWWAMLFLLECVACALVFTAIKALGLLPSLPTSAKVALISAAALCLTGGLGLAYRRSRRSGKRL